MCHQSVGLVQSIIEKSGISTVSITLLPEITERVRPPRTLSVDRPLGYPLGEPDNPALRLYERHGFKKVGESGESATMLASLGST